MGSGATGRPELGSVIHPPHLSFSPSMSAPIPSSCFAPGELQILSFCYPGQLSCPPPPLQRSVPKDPGAQQNKGNLFGIINSNPRPPLYLLFGTQTPTRMRTPHTFLSTQTGPSPGSGLHQLRGAACPDPEPSVHLCSHSDGHLQTLHGKAGPNVGSATLPVSPPFKSLPLQFIATICTWYFLLFRLFFRLAPVPPSLPPFVICVRKQALIVSGPKPPPEQPQPAPVTGLITGRAAGTPRSSRGTACPLPKEAVLAGPPWE